MSFADTAAAPLLANGYSFYDDPPPATSYNANTIPNLLSKYTKLINEAETAINAMKVAQESQPTLTSKARGHMQSCLEQANEMTKQLYALFKTDEHSASSLMTDVHSRSEDSAPGIKLTDTASTLTKTMAETGSNFFIDNPAKKQQRAEFNKLRRDFQKEMMRLERLTKRAEEMERSTVMRISTRGSDMSFSSFSGEANEEADTNADSDANFGQARTYDATTFSEVVVEERNREIGNIQSSMVKINEVYNDLANLVDEQQVEIDDIEQNIVATHERTEAGLLQLAVATTTQKSTGKCFRWLIAVVLVGAVVAIVILYGGEMGLWGK